ncbi:MAG: histidine phosphatase family protein [Verrucomicrobia bacterium]|nr:histidine phosphatase family protein [Verrucomicrobiota bacterium]
MNDPLPVIYLARHGETAWSLSGQHTGRTDLPLTSQGEENARRLGERLRTESFPHVWCSPLQRAAQTCALAGFGSVAVADSDLMEWDYGDYEGRKTSEIRRERPDWDLFRDGCPGGETLAAISERADRVVARLRSAGGRALIFSSGHILRVITARWLGLPASEGRLFLLGTASLSQLSYEHTRERPAIQLWNDTQHLTVPILPR